MWTDPLTSVAAGQANYTYDDNSGFQSGASYEYRLAAQDCSPKLSTPVSAFPARRFRSRDDHLEE